MKLNGRLRDPEEKLLLDIAEKHLNYIITDPELNPTSKVYRGNKAIEFYSYLLQSLGMVEALSHWQRRSTEQMIGSSTQLYPLQSLFEVTGVARNNVAMFNAIDKSGATILRQDYQGNRGFFVSKESAERIVLYLESKGSLRLEGKICS